MVVVSSSLGGCCCRLYAALMAPWGWVPLFSGASHGVVGEVTVGCFVIIYVPSVFIVVVGRSDYGGGYSMGDGYRGV